MKKNKIILAGAAPDTGNLGVSALLESIIEGINDDKKDLIILDHNQGIRCKNYKINKKLINVSQVGAKYNKRFYQKENLINILWSSKISNGKFNSIAEIMLSGKAMLDISGGDSFTDLYGNWRYRAITLPKIIAITNKIPLILMPQTYGPFLTKKTEKSASEIVKKAEMAFSRDEESFNILKEMLGNSFDSEIHQQGVDVAFLLAPEKPLYKLPSTMTNWLNSNKKNTIGINVSGLIYNQLEKSYSQYGFKADYQKVMYQLITKFLIDTDVNIILVPHVLVSEENYESDLLACKKVYNLLSENDKERVCVLSTDSRPSEIKWIISQLDWFCGTRMHSTIAGLSSCVPTTAISYSIKTMRVFKTCKQENQVVDPCQLSTIDVVDKIWECWLQRNKVRNELYDFIPEVFKKAKNQMDIVNKKIISL